MKPIILILAAFLLQSCYTAMYGPFDDHSSTVTEYAPPPPDTDPVYCPPQPVCPQPVSMPEPNIPDPVHPRTGSSTHEPVNSPPAAQNPVRERVTAQPGTSTQPQQPQKENQNPAPAQDGERKRVGSQQSQSTPQRPR